MIDIEPLKGRAYPSVYSGLNAIPPKHKGKGVMIRHLSGGTKK
jgi:hypothetical protein